MNNYVKATTNVGFQKIQEALLAGTKLNLKYIALGDGVLSKDESHLSEMTSLVNEKYRVEVSEITTLSVSAHIPSNIGGFYIREIGLFDSENNLIQINEYPETYKPIEKENCIKQLWIKYNILAIPPDVIEIKVDPNIQNASVQWVLELFNGHKHPDLMPIWLYDTNGNGVVDSCEFVDGGKFSDGGDVNLPQPPAIPELIMSTTIYDKNNNGIVDDAENINAGEF